jgi:hypothetical protein
MTTSTASLSGALKGQLYADTRVSICACGTATAMACQCKICSATGRLGVTGVQDNAAGQQTQQFNTACSKPLVQQHSHGLRGYCRACRLTASSS